MAARENYWIAAECLEKFRQGEKGEDAEVGAALLAEALLRVIHALAPNK